MTMAVWRGYCGTGGKPAGNREDKLDPNQPEKSIYSTLRTLPRKYTEGHGTVSGQTIYFSAFFRVLSWPIVLHIFMKLLK
jgi:hypothetical protein